MTDTTRPRPPRPKRKCSVCKGLGWVWKSTQDKNGKWIKYQKSCENCGGTGETS